MWGSCNFASVHFYVLFFSAVIALLLFSKTVLPNTFDELILMTILKKERKENWPFPTIFFFKWK